MAYEKYIKKDGKIYGPYLYQSKRVDGKVISEYHGQKKADIRRFLWIVPAILLIVLGAYLIGQRNFGSTGTGYSVLDLNANYQEGKALSGDLKLSLEEGELIPASSTLVFENSGNKYEYTIKDIIAEPTSEGDFFVNGKNISGSGEGFGIPGEREVYPEVFFTLLVSSPIAQEGDVLTESEKKVQGSVSSGNTFTYELQEGERAELEPRSVRTSSVQITDDSVLMTTEGNTISVSTAYSEKETGFGSDFIGTRVKEIGINLDGLNLSAEKGELKVGIFYQGEEIASIQTSIDNESGDRTEISTQSEPISEGTGQTTEETQEPETATTETNETTVTKQIPLIPQTTELTQEETAVLEKEFGNISLEIKQENIKNGFIIITYQLRDDTWVNYSYSSDLDNKTLQAFMQQDRIKWLKDLAKKYSG
ncbi:MAG: hypothetical protein AABX79_01080 [Nanoarchaeota archaeon]